MMRAAARASPASPPRTCSAASISAIFSAASALISGRPGRSTARCAAAKGRGEERTSRSLSRRRSSGFSTAARRRCMSPIRRFAKPVEARAPKRARNRGLVRNAPGPDSSCEANAGRGSACSRSRHVRIAAAAAPSSIRRAPDARGQEESRATRPSRCAFRLASRTARCCAWPAMACPPTSRRRRPAISLSSSAPPPIHASSAAAAIFTAPKRSRSSTPSSARASTCLCSRVNRALRFPPARSRTRFCASSGRDCRALAEARAVTSTSAFRFMCRSGSRTASDDCTSS